jgi:hypothetical protein
VHIMALHMTVKIDLISVKRDLISAETTMHVRALHMTAIVISARVDAHSQE